jgi:phosphoinositide-3-kinase, regulatory subunit 4
MGELFSDGPSLIVLALVTTNIRNCVLPSVKIRALDVLLALAVHLTDEAKLDRLIPYAVELLHDEAPTVRIAAFRTVIQIVGIFDPISLIALMLMTTAYDGGCCDSLKCRHNS